MSVRTPQSAEPYGIDLAGKRIVVTGGANGIGFATSRLLVGAGARVAIADLDEAGARKAADRLGPDSAIAIRVDVCDGRSVAAMVDVAVARFGGLDGMFNNAGIIHPQDGDVTETDDQAWEKTLAVNLSGVFRCCRAGLPAIMESGGGAIVNNASVVGLVGSYPSQIAYTASKGGVIAMTRELGVAYARRGVRVNSVSPGITQTAMSAQVGATGSDDRRSQVLQHIPMGRYATPQEVGAAVAYLLSDLASYVTAQNWPIDGGLTEAYLCPPFGDPT